MLLNKSLFLISLILKLVSTFNKQNNLHQLHFFVITLQNLFVTTSHYLNINKSVVSSVLKTFLTLCNYKPVT